MHGHSIPHTVNIILHVACGSVALLLGLAAILSRKGGRLHVFAGLGFVYVYCGVIATAMIGLFVFNFRSFLAIVTLLSLYDVFSGMRALKLRGRRPRPVDIAAALLGLSAPWVFLAAMRYLHQPWSPVLTWSILGALVMMSSYDLLRTVLPQSWLQRTWLQEHLVKMISAYVAITSAFAGTVLPGYMPWSAVVPSTLGTLVSVSFLIAGPRVWLKPDAAQDRMASRAG